MIELQPHTPWQSGFDSDGRLVHNQRLFVKTHIAVDELHLHQVGAGWRPTFELPGGQAYWEIPSSCKELHGHRFEVIDISSTNSAVGEQSFERHPGLICPSFSVKDHESSKHCHADTLFEFLSSYSAAISEAIEQSSVSTKLGKQQELSPVNPAIVLSYFQDEAESENPPKTKIVKIARQTPLLLRDLCSKPRHVLRKEREKVRINQVKKLDTACVRWLAKQPGRTNIERAGARQRIKAVIRRINHNILENQVLKDFIKRCSALASAYLKQYSDKSQSKRYKDVNSFAKLLRKLYKTEFLRDVGSLTRLPKPNYVLLSDRRYKELWRWYLEIRREQEEHVKEFAWRESLWGEVVRLSIAQVYRKLEEQGQSDLRFEELIYLRNSIRHGCLLGGDGSFGPWFVEDSGGALDWVLISRESLTTLAEEEPDLLPILTQCPEAILLGVSASTHKRFAIGVWTRFEDALSISAINDKLVALLKCTNQGEFRIGALVVEFSKSSYDRPLTPRHSKFVAVVQGDLRSKSCVGVLSRALRRIMSALQQ